MLVNQLPMHFSVLVIALRLFILIVIVIIERLANHFNDLEVNCFFLYSTSLGISYDQALDDNPI